jgi:hypothetical protein
MNHALAALDECLRGPAAPFTYCAVMIHTLMLALAQSAASGAVGEPLKKHLMGLSPRMRRQLVHPSSALEAFVHVHEQVKPALAVIFVQWLDEAGLKETASVVSDLSMIATLW